MKKKVSIKSVLVLIIIIFASLFAGWLYGEERAAREHISYWLPNHCIIKGAFYVVSSDDYTDLNMFLASHKDDMGMENVPVQLIADEFIRINGIEKLYPDRAVLLPVVELVSKEQWYRYMEDGITTGEGYLVEKQY